MKSNHILLFIFVLSIVTTPIFSNEIDIPESIPNEIAENLIIENYPSENPIYIESSIFNSIPIHICDSDAYFRTHNIKGYSLRKKEYCDQLVQLGLLTPPQHHIELVDNRNSIRGLTFGGAMQDNSSKESDEIEVEAYIYELTELGKRRYKYLTTDNFFGSKSGFRVGTLNYEKILDKGQTTRSLLGYYYCSVLINQIVEWSIWEGGDIQRIQSLANYEESLKIDFLYEDGEWQL